MLQKKVVPDIRDSCEEPEMAKSPSEPGKLTSWLSVAMLLLPGLLEFWPLLELFCLGETHFLIKV